MIDINAQAKATLAHNRVAVFVVAYNAANHIEQVLRRIPDWIARSLAEVYVVDDHSTDSTQQVAESVSWPEDYAPLRIFRTPDNQGYGGNQRLGYLYAIERGFDIVVLLHGDGQYAPEALPEILAPYADGAHAVFGSRFLKKGGARKGGMPLYKWLGNRVLTGFQNWVLGKKMSEMHSGYRSYRTDVLQAIPFTRNSLDFAFDADIIIQLHAGGFKITEVEIPTYYGDEICYVNGFKYAFQCAKTSVRYYLMQYELCYDPKFDIRSRSYSPYTRKVATTSLHHYIRNIPLKDHSSIIDVGGGTGDAVGRDLAKRGHQVTCIDQNADPADNLIDQHCVDLNEPWDEYLPEGKFQVAVALDIIEHLQSPEVAAAQLFRLLPPGGTLYASTGNVAFFVVRLALLIGWFNYGRRGILDLTHTRLFTVPTFTRLLTDAGFMIERISGFGPPVADLNGGRSRLLRLIDRILASLASLWPKLFAYQILIQCSRPHTCDELVEDTFGSPIQRDFTDAIPVS